MSEIQKALGIVKKIDLCYYKWAVVRSDILCTCLSVIDSLKKIDFNLLVKETNLNLSNATINWAELIDSNGTLHLNYFVPYLNFDVNDNTLELEKNADIDKALLRQVGFLEDENMRLRRSVLQQINNNSRSEMIIEDLSKKFDEVKNYSFKLEEEVQRLQKIKFELEEQVLAHELTNKSLLKQFNSKK